VFANDSSQSRAESVQHRKEIIFHVDSVNEAVLIAAACVDRTERGKLVKMFPRPESMNHPVHRVIWGAIVALERKGLEFDLETIRTLDPGVDLEYLGAIVEARPRLPPNIEHHIERHHSDRQRIQVSTGPLAELTEGIIDPRVPQETLRARARQIVAILEGGGTGGQHFVSNADVTTRMFESIQAAQEGKYAFPYGMECLDKTTTGDPKTSPGASPGHVTTITGSSGSGKSIVAIHAIAGLIAQKRKVLAFMPEMEEVPTKKILIGILLNISRTDIFRGRLTEEQIEAMKKMAVKVDRYLQFMGNPFGTGEGESNDKNLDIVQSHIAQYGAHVFVADLWDRIIVDERPQSEKRALLRTQAMAKELRVHMILSAQDKLKETEKQDDKRPTRANIKGSSAWVDISDRIFGVFNPSLWKDVPGNVREIICLKDRWNPGGFWSVEVDYDVEKGRLGPGFREQEYHPPGSASTSSAMDDFSPIRSGTGRRRRKNGQ
jgi:archaellum biogenesis ATPase FlaH